MIDERYCDFVLDFLHAGKISRRFRGVMIKVQKAARSEAMKLGKPYRPVALPRGELFRVFSDRKRASRKCPGTRDMDGLCSVPSPLESGPSRASPAYSWAHTSPKREQGTGNALSSLALRATVSHAAPGGPVW